MFVPPHPSSFESKEPTVAKTDDRGPVNPWINELMITQLDQSHTLINNPMQQYSTGAIDTIEIPPSWVGGKELSGIVNGTGTYKEFIPGGASDNSTRIEFYERGVPLPPAESNAFGRLLAAPDHKLTSNEVKSLGSILKYKNDPNVFRMDDSHTETLNGNKVLMIDGEFLSNGRKSKTMLFDKEGNGKYVQEVSYLAPASKFDVQKPAAEQAFKSIEWR